MARKLPPVFLRHGDNADQSAEAQAKPKRSWLPSGDVSPTPPPTPVPPTPAAGTIDAPDAVAAVAAVFGVMWLLYLALWGLAPAALPKREATPLEPALVVIEPMTFDGVKRPPTWDELFSVHRLENELRNITIRRNQKLSPEADISLLLSQPLELGRTIRIYLARPQEPLAGRATRPPVKPASKTRVP